MQSVFMETHRVRHHECDAEGFLKISSLLDCFQDGAACHASILHVGMEALQEKKVIWVLSRLQTALARLPRLGEEVTLETYPSGFDKLFAVRQYALRDASGALIVTGTSDWLLLDLQRGRPLSALRELGEIMPRNEEKTRFFGSMGKIAVPETLHPCGDYRVGQGDVDLNRHLNNAVYARFVSDALGTLSGGLPQFGTLNFSYQHAALPGDLLSTAGRLEEDGSFYVEGNSPEGVRYFQASGRARIVPFVQ